MSGILGVDEYVSPSRVLYRIIKGYWMVSDDEIITLQEREANQVSDKGIQSSLMYKELFDKPSKRKSADSE